MFLGYAKQIILLNGVGSAGKARSQRRCSGSRQRHFLHVAMDAFIDMMPERSFDHPDGLSLRDRAAGWQALGHHSYRADGRAVFRGMRRAIAALAAEGNNLIVDDVLLGEEEGEYAELLAGFQFFRSASSRHSDSRGTRAPAQRSIDRPARWQFDKVHRDMIYDLEVDSQHNDAPGLRRADQGEIQALAGSHHDNVLPHACSANSSAGAHD